MITSDALSAQRRTAVLELLDAVTATDGVAPLDEAARLALVDGEARHLLIEEQGQAIAYTNILPDGTVQGMVHPHHRRRGHGSTLLSAALEHRPDAGVWAHGALPAALSFLTGAGLTETRRLLTLHRPLGPEHPVAAAPPARIAPVELSPFDAERDSEDWLRVNSAAFADHPEQGAMTREDLDRRLAEPWFDPEDLLLARHDGELLGFVWVKQEQAPSPEATAEIYVVGTAPAAQGKGIAALLLATSLMRLQDAGVNGVELYVEADNTSAIALYERWGFTLSGQDVQLRRIGA